VRFNLTLPLAVVILVFSASCLHQDGKNISQGEIHYSINYAGSIGAIPKEVLPKSMVVSFKDNKILFEMISPVGNSGIMNLANPEKDIYDTYFSLFTIKYYYAAKKGEMYPGFEAMEGMELKKTDRTAVLCGFNCKNAEVTFPSDRNKKYDVWYTNEINVMNPNASSPFHEIDGVLMNFFFLIGHSELEFTAETVYRRDIPNKVFEHREKFVKASREDIIKFINKMLML
jgi:hypothetical protein